MVARPRSFTARETSSLESSRHAGLAIARRVEDAAERMAEADRKDAPCDCLIPVNARK